MSNIVNYKNYINYISNFVLSVPLKRLIYLKHCDEPPESNIRVFLFLSNKTLLFAMQTGLVKTLD